MPLLPYAHIETPEQRRIADRVRSARGELLHLYRMLLHSPPLAEGWLDFLSAVRGRAELPGRLRELVILQIAALNGASYEADQHAPVARAEGLSAAQIIAVEDREAWASPDSPFDDLERAVLEFSHAVTCAVRPNPTLTACLARDLGARGLVELAVTVGAYNMVSRVLEALEIRSCDEAVAS